MNPETAASIELVNAVAVFLNAGEKSEVWAFKPLNEDYPTQYIIKVAQPECELAFHTETYGSQKGKVTIHGNFHIGHSGNKFVDIREFGTGGYFALPSISVTIARGPEAIAKEIKRRFLPEYLPLLAKAIVKRDSREAYENQTRANLLRLAAIVNQSIKDLREDTDRVTVYKDKFYGEIQCSDTKATLTIHDLSIEGAEQILRLVQDGNVRFSGKGDK
jgi:hypothetical protein